AIPSDVGLEGEQSESAEQPRRKLPRSAAAYEIAIGLLAFAAALPFLGRLGDVPRDKWTTFAILAAGAALTHTYTVRTSRDTAFHTSWVFLIPSAMLLPPELVALVGIVMHIPEWLKERYAWYIQSFNICNYTLGNLGTWGAATIMLNATGLIPDDHLRWALAG